jgi:putative membrane protein
MKNSRRQFVTKSIKSAALVGAGATFIGTLLESATVIAQPGPSDAAYRSKIAMLGTASLQTSQLALTKATNPQVKLFAKFEAAEQQTIGTILKDMGTPDVAADTEGKVLFTKLQGLSGSAFDKAFMEGQVQTHQKLHQAVTAYKNSSKDKQVKHLTSLALATIEEHTERGQMLVKQLA